MISYQSNLRATARFTTIDHQDTALQPRPFNVDHGKTSGDLTSALLSASSQAAQWQHVCNLITRRQAAIGAILVTMVEGALRVFCSDHFRKPAALLFPCEEPLGACERMKDVMSSTRLDLLRRQTLQPGEPWMKTCFPQRLLDMKSGGGGLSAIFDFDSAGYAIVHVEYHPDDIQADEVDVDGLNQIYHDMRASMVQSLNAYRQVLETLVNVSDGDELPCAILGFSSKTLVSNHKFSPAMSSLMLNARDIQALFGHRPGFGALPAVALAQRPKTTHCLPLEIGEQRFVIRAKPLSLDQQFLLSGAAARVTVHEIGCSSEVPVPVLMKLFGLTQREAQTAKAIGQGRRIREIACEHGVSESTTRIYVKSAFRKLGINSQVELISKIRL